jgi:hypothetical protein
MAGYSRKTALKVSEVLSQAETLLPEMLGIARIRASGHSATYSGAEGSVTLSAHGHGLYTEVIASTDRLRTSRMDVEIQKFLNHLPYEPGDRGGPGSGEFARPLPD